MKPKKPNLYKTWNSYVNFLMKAEGKKKQISRGQVQELLGIICDHLFVYSLYLDFVGEDAGDAARSLVRWGVPAQSEFLVREGARRYLNRMTKKKAKK